MKLVTKTLLACTAAAAFVGSAVAETINFNYVRSGSTTSAVVGPGYGLWDQGTEAWNVRRTGSGATPVALFNSEGDLSDVTVTVVRAGDNNSTGNGPDDLTLQIFTSNNNDSFDLSMTIGGLDPNTAYELITYHIFSTSTTVSNRPETATGASAVSPSDFTGSTTTTGGNDYVDGFGTADNVASNFYYYASVTPDSNGNIVVAPPSDEPGIESFAGFQIRPVPEPGSLALLGLGGLLIGARRRRD